MGMSFVSMCMDMGIYIIYPGQNVSAWEGERQEDPFGCCPSENWQGRS